MQLARSGLTQNKPPPPPPFRVGAEGAGWCYLPGLEPGRWPYVYHGQWRARCWWGWWVLVSGAVVSRVVLQGGVRSVMGCCCGCRC